MKTFIKKLALYIIVITISASITVPALAAEPTDKCKITVNTQTMEWNLEPFWAYGPQSDVTILIPMRDLFTSLGYTVSYDHKSDCSVFTANKKSAYISFYVDVKTGQIVKEGDKIKKNTENQVYLINDFLYITNDELKTIAKSFLTDSSVEIDYVYNKSITGDYYIVQYSDYFPVESNLISLTMEVHVKYPDHSYVGEKYTKYNTGDWVSGADVKQNFDEITLRSLWDGFDNLRFYTGKDEKNELTGKGRWNSSAYAIAWELMDSTAEEINTLRKQNGLPDLAVDNSLCFMSVGASESEVDSVFDNAIHNIESNKAAHTYNGKTKMAECIASVRLNGEEIIFKEKYDNSTAVIARNTVNAWYKSSKGHREIILGAKYKTMGILVIITDTGTGDAYAVFK
ncbi:MAG: CAP domain-containing protein [Oscillospiraceae bacterium]|nr:CAP domain-containing protein [Oscillospiraceae bacterium]